MYGGLSEKECDDVIYEMDKNGFMNFALRFD